MAQAHDDPAVLGRATPVFLVGLTAVHVLVALATAVPVLAEDRAGVGNTATGTLQIRLVLPPRVTVEAVEPSAIQTQADDPASDQLMVCLHHLPTGSVRVLWEESRRESDAFQASAMQGSRKMSRRPGCYYMPDSYLTSNEHQRVLIAAD
ncbi:hypothetical protein [Microbulbifer sp. Q7]|uniref:hypothetical protein n=1 Tax=Microbulbifer sp. Q7 TaxID=1785091 RepID=UPI000831088E|nr:hypothetical protein [Microbulbifer sp. Q7]